jgi:hypothetical protein
MARSLYAWLVSTIVVAVLAMACNTAPEKQAEPTEHVGRTEQAYTASTSVSWATHRAAQWLRRGDLRDDVAARWQ